MSSRIRAFLAIAVLVIGIAGLNWIHPESTDVVRASTTDSTQAARPRVLVISIDGMRPDLLLLGDTPVVHDLIKTGSYSMWAQTTAVAITLPSHVSMLTGVRPNAHGIDWNRDLPLNERVYPAVPTYFELAKLAGYSTAMVAGKDKLSVLNKPGTIDWSITPATGWANHESVERDAVRLITSQKPEVMFVHFSDVDVSGHQSGWSSKEQMNAIAKVDKSIGMVLDALKAAGVR